MKLARNRKILRKSAEQGIWPKPEYLDSSDSDPEFEIGEKRKKSDVDEGMDSFWKMIQMLDRSEKPNKGILLIMENLSTFTSTIGLMQTFDEVLIKKIVRFLKGDPAFNFVSGIDNTDLHLEVRKNYPVLMDIFLALVNHNGILGKPER